jgi:hypothetical protein
VRLRGFDELHAPFLKERRTRGLVRCSEQEIRGISLVFREMWDTTALHREPLDVTPGSRKSDGCPSIRKKALSRAKIS